MKKTEKQLDQETGVGAAKSDGGTPKKNDLSLIPPWARLALLARSVRRVEPLLRALWPVAPAKFLRITECTLANAELAASQGKGTSNLSEADFDTLIKMASKSHPEISESSLLSSSMRESRSALGMSILTKSFVAALWQISLACESDDVAIAFECIIEIKGVVRQYDDVNAAMKVKEGVVAAIRADYELILSAANNGHWTANTVVPADFFGPLWPSGEPRNWPKPRPPQTRDGRKTKGATQHVDEMGLPVEMVEFIGAGKQLNYDASQVECREVKLKSLAQLKVGEFTLTSEGGIGYEWDPHKDEDGYYILRVIDLVGECKNYGTEGILAWFCDYQRFGTWDCDHHCAFMFSNASWDDIVADPATYLNAQWNPTSKIGSYVEPSEICKFRPRRWQE